MNFKLQIYNDNCMSLAKSMIVKSDLLARDVEYVYKGGSSYLDDPLHTRDKWKYYLNISGQYHVTNEPMIITSLDSQLDIEFTKENLLNHPITAGRYSINSDMLNSLISRYPNNHQLIIGIVSNVDINDAINAPEYTILSYDEKLVDPQEIFLISELQNRLYGEFSAYVNKDYVDIELYYATLAMANIAKQILIYIKIIRLKYHRTSNASDFYIWNYINSRLYLEDLKYNLNRNEIMYLYRNINRMVKESGTNKILKEIINEFLVPRNIETLRLNLVINNSEIDSEESKSYLTFVEEGYESSISTREVLPDSYIDHFLNTSSYEIPNYLPQLEEKLRFIRDKEGTRLLKLEETIRGVVDTQLLLTDIDVRAYLGLKGIDTNIHDVPNHITGKIHTLSVVEVFILYKYLVSYRLGNVFEIIPNHQFYMVNELTLPTIDYLMDKYDITELHAKAILDLIPKIPTGFVTNEMVDTFLAEWKALLPKLTKIIRRLSNRHNQAKMQTLVDEFYFTGDLDLAIGEVTYAAWLKERDIELGDFGDVDYDILEDYIVANIFKADRNGEKSSYLNTIIELMSRFNNYRIDVVGESNSSNIVDHHLTTVYHDLYLTDVELGRDTYDIGVGIIDGKTESIGTTNYNIISKPTNMDSTNRVNDDVTIRYNFNKLGYSSSETTVARIKSKITN